MLLFVLNLGTAGVPITTGTVPDLVGLSYSAAAVEAVNLGFSLIDSSVYFAGGEYSVYDLDLVASQDPAAGTTATLGTILTATRSLGPDPRNFGEVTSMRFTPYYSTMRFKVQ